jgi:hypothetical protein
MVDATLFMSDGMQVPAVYVGGVAEMLPMGDDVVRLPHASVWSKDTGTDPTSCMQAVSLKSFTVVEHVAPIGGPQLQTHSSVSSKYRCLAGHPVGQGTMPWPHKQTSKPSTFA